MPINSFLYPAKHVPVAYEVANSLRFDDDSSHSLTRTFGSGNQKTWTWSSWVKKTANLTTLGNFDFVLFNGYQDNNNRLSIFYSQTQADGSVDDCLKIFGTASGSTSVNAFTSALYRDNSAWYHVVCAFDTTQATGSNRIKIYVNGVQQTLTFGTTPAQDSNQSINFNQNHTIGNYNTNTASAEFDGYLAETVFIDGQALDPTSFGEFDEDTNIWKPKDVSGLTFGTNGFYLDFENSGSLGADVSGNGNNFTVNNLTSIDQSTDTCTNNYCTLSSLWNFNGNFILSDGNLNFIGTGNNDGTAGTMGVSSGKWYFEAEFDTNSSACYAGWGDAELLNTTGTGNPITTFIGMYRDDYTIQIGGGSVTTYTTVSDGDIFGFAINLDASSGSKTVIVQKNGSTIDTITIPTANENNFFIPVCGDTSSTDGRLKFNFGNPFETLSSGNSDANGYGNFEYSPTISSVNYYALNTKNLAEYG